MSETDTAPLLDQRSARVRALPDGYIRLDAQWRVVSAWERPDLEWTNGVKALQVGVPVFDVWRDETLLGWPWGLERAALLKGRRAIPVPYEWSRNGRKHLRVAYIRQLQDGGYSIVIEHLLTTEDA